MGSALKAVNIFSPVPVDVNEELLSNRDSFAEFFRGEAHVCKYNGTAVDVVFLKTGVSERGTVGDWWKLFCTQ
jgi:hypothetical protein